MVSDEIGKTKVVLNLLLYVLYDFMCHYMGVDLEGNFFLPEHI
jgi:hypothetical protein